MQRRAFIGGISAMTVSTGCRPLPAIGTVSYPSEGADALVMMLPGLGDPPEIFEERGFIGMLPKAGVNADVVAVNAHLGHYVDRELLPRLSREVVAPSRDQSYRSRWAVGVSMGGFGALLAGQAFAQDLAGMVVLSPYLGDQKLFHEIEAAGGLARWEPKETRGKRGDIVALWRWLKTYVGRPEAQPSLFLGYGSKEKDLGYRLLAEVLPPAHVVVEDGRHGWKTWSAAFASLLSRQAIRST